MSIRPASSFGVLALRNLRRARVQLAVVALLSLVAGALLNLGALCGIRYPQLIRGEAERLDAPQIVLLTPTTEAARTQAYLRSDARVSQVDSMTVLSERASLRLRSGSTAADLVYVDLDQQPALGRTEILERGDATVQDPVYLPHLFRATGDYGIGDPFTVTTSAGLTRTFHVAGFFENVYLGFITMGATGLGLPHDEYVALGNASTPPDRLAFLQAKVPDRKQITPVTADLTARLSAPSGAGHRSWVWNWDGIQIVTMTGPMLYALSLVLFALVVTLIVLMAIGFWIRGAIDQDLPAIGTLETFGFRSGQIVRGLALPAALVVLLGATVGVVASYAAVPLIAESLAGQTGMPWHPRPDVVSAVVIVLMLTLAALVPGMLAARSLRRLEPVAALRNRIASRTFRRNWLPLSAARGNLQMHLGLKQASANRTQSILVAAVCLVVGLGSIFSASLFTNVLSNKENFMHMLVGDYGQVAARIAPDADPDAVLAEVRAIPGVQKAVLKDFLQGSAANTQSLAVVMDDFEGQTFSSVAEGREPRHANEIAVGAVLARSTGKSVGQSISVRVGSTTADFLIVGTLSTVQYGGDRMDLTTAGYRRLVPNFQHEALDIAVQPGTSPTAVIDAMSRRLDGRLSSVTNQQQDLDGQFSVYLSMMKALGWGVLAVSVAVTGLVMALVVSTLLARERTAFGVRRALGFTGLQLMGQLIAAYVPLVTAGTAAGCLAGLFVVPRLLGSFLATVGVARASLDTSAAMVGIIGGGLVALAAMMVLLGAGPLLRREPVTLLAQRSG